MTKVTASTPERTFASLLHDLRLDSGLSQDALASRAGLSRDAIAALERGRRKRPRPETARVLADALGIQGAARSNFLTHARGNAATARWTPEVERVENVSPAASTSVIGRENEIARVIDLLELHRFVTLTGPGGIGKTRLATEVMSRTRLERTFIDLSTLLDPGLLTGSFPNTSVWGQMPASRRSSPI